MVASAMRAGRARATPSTCRPLAAAGVRRPRRCGTKSCSTSSSNALEVHPRRRRRRSGCAGTGARRRAHRLRHRVGIAGDGAAAAVRAVPPGRGRLGRARHEGSGIGLALVARDRDPLHGGEVAVRERARGRAPRSPSRIPCGARTAAERPVAHVEAAAAGRRALMDEASVATWPRRTRWPPPTAGTAPDTPTASRPAGCSSPTTTPTCAPTSAACSRPRYAVTAVRRRRGRA